MAIDLNDIKTEFKTILDNENSTSAAYDLSAGLNTRVQRVMKVNPLKIPVQPSFFPYVTIYTDSKEPNLDTIAKNQTSAKRKADITFTIIGAVWELLTQDIDVDEADEEVERLMENVEEIIRRNYTLNDSVSWTRPGRIQYHSLPLDEDTHMRVGELPLIARVSSY